MSEIIEASPEGDGAVVRIGQGRQTDVSLQVVQSIWHELTGKREEVTKSWSDSFKFEHTDFEQLIHRIRQSCEQYNVKGEEISIVVYYIDDTSDTFKSLERFTAHHASSASPVESVLITLSYLIIPPKVKETQTYEISLRFASRISIHQKLKGEGIFFSGLPRIVRLMGTRTAITRIKYVDYVIARSMLHTIEEWAKTVAKSQENKIIKYIESRSELLPPIFRYVTGAIFACILLSFIPTFVGKDATLQSLAYFLTGSALSIFVTYKLAHHLGQVSEIAFDSYSAISYIHLTKGDKQQIEKAKSDNKTSVALGIFSFLGTFAVNVSGKILAAALSMHIPN